jgi:hypothetical protein
VNTEIETLVIEAVDLRHQVKFPTVVTPDSLVLSVVHLRQAFDRVEAILVMMTRLRGRLAAELAVAQAEQEGAWDRAATASSRSGSQRDFSGPRERYAEFNLAAFKEKTALRHAELRYKEVDVAVDVIRILHRGIDSVRSDIHIAMRAMNLESRLEV